MNNILKVFSTLIILLWVNASLFASTYYISITGSNSNSGLSENNAWRTISYAASSISPIGPGDVVYVKAGNYGNEQAVFQTDGTAGAPIKFIGYQNTPGDEPNLNFSYGDQLNASVMPLLQGASRTSGYAMIMHSRSYIEVSNFQISNYVGGVFGTAVSGLKIKNVIAMEFGNQNADYSGRAIVLGSSANNCTVEDCFIMNACAEGLAVVGNGNVIRNCSVYADDNSTGVDSAMDYYIIVSGDNNLIENSYVERVGDLDHTGHGISLKGSCDNNIVRTCTSKNMAYSGYQLRHRGVTNNLIEDCISIGCAILVTDGASNNIIRNCKIDGSDFGVGFMDNSEDGGAQYAGRYNVFENCIFQNTSHSVIDFFHYTELTIADQNTFLNCVFDGAQNLFRSTRPNDNNKMVNCIVSNIQNYSSTVTFPINFDFETTYFYNNGFAAPSGTNVTSANPLYVNASANNYQLQAGSPCIDAGDNSQASSVDFNWNPRPFNGIVDIGAYEYGSGSCPPVGTVCNDGDPNTNNDAQDGNCNCTGVICPQTIIENNTPLSQSLFHADVSVNSAGRVLSGSNAEMKAGSYVALNPQFEVETGAVFYADIEGCNTSPISGISINCPSAGFTLNNCNYTISWTHNNPSSSIVNYDLNINGIDPGPSVLYPVSSNTIDICSLIGMGSGTLSIELFYWYNGDTSNIMSAGTCMLNFNFN